MSALARLASARGPLLLSACEGNRKDEVKQLISAGASVDFQNGSGETPLMFAAVGDYNELTSVPIYLDHSFIHN
jgi:ankyrin repeat protein